MAHCGNRLHTSMGRRSRFAALLGLAALALLCPQAFARGRRLKEVKKHEGGRGAKAESGGGADRDNSGNGKKEPRCDIFEGKWVRDNEHRPAYNEQTCPFLDTSVGIQQNCLNQKGRDPSWMMYSWKADSCGDEPLRFNARRFLEGMRNKVLGFVGDSLMTRNFVPALLCMISAQGFKLYEGEPPKWMGSKGGVWREGEYNVTLVSVWSPFLAWHTQDHKMLKEMGNTEPGFRDAIVDPSTPDGTWASDLGFYDVIMLQSSFHWVKTGSRRGIMHYFVHPDMKLMQPKPDHLDAYRTMMHTVLARFKLREQQGQKNPVPYFLSPPPRLGGCQTAKNISTESQVRELAAFNPQSAMWLPMQRDILMKTPVRHVDITHMSLFRPDAFMGSGRPESNDCLHSCLPGLPDTWVELTAQVLLYDPQVSPFAQMLKKKSHRKGNFNGGKAGGGKKKKTIRKRFAFKFKPLDFQ